MLLNKIEPPVPLVCVYAFAQKAFVFRATERGCAVGFLLPAVSPCKSQQRIGGSFCAFHGARKDVR